MTWDLERVDWKSLRAMGSAEHVPAAIDALASAQTQAEADAAYWRIDNVVLVQGALFEAALPTTRCVVSALPRCTDVARPRMLELLAQLGGGEPGLAETGRGPESLRALCIHEISLGLACYVSHLEHGTETERMWCVDLLGLCASEDRALVERVAWYLGRLRQEAPGTDLEKIIDAWVRDWLT